LKLIGSRNKGDIEGSLVLRGWKWCGHNKPAIGYGAIQIRDVGLRVGDDAQGGSLRNDFKILDVKCGV
jgi:hypothetical protein